MEIIRIKLPFSNAYLVKDRKAILVDAGAPNQADKILSAVQKAGVSPGDISLILHTHGHFDHAGSTAELKRRLGVPTAVHASDAFMLQKGINGEIKPRNFEARIIMALVPNSFEPSKPDILLEEELALTDFGIDGKVLFTPGHTRGSISFLSKNRAIIGDLLMGGWAGGAVLASRPNYHYFIDDPKQLHTSLKKILSYKPSTLYVGHGGPLTFNSVSELFQQFYEFKE
jgi:glyoxylase-like metal-dependent hydrolase (beta-lactamase superfamily II)